MNELTVDSLEAPELDALEQRVEVLEAGTIQEVSPGFGNHHVVNGSPPKSYPLVAGQNIAIATCVETRRETSRTCSSPRIWGTSRARC